VSKLKEATIDVGPQPAKFAKFSSIPLRSLIKLLTEEQQENLNFSSNHNSDISIAIVDCLLVITEIAFEIWVIKGQSINTKFIDIECVFRKQELGVELIDFIHVIPE
jgi:hypothetical protein